MKKRSNTRKSTPRCWKPPRADSDAQNPRKNNIAAIVCPKIPYICGVIKQKKGNYRSKDREIRHTEKRTDRS